MKMINKNDYMMKVPRELHEMAITIEDWFISQGVKKWKLMGICSRNHTHEIDRLEEKLYQITEVINKRI